MEFDNPYSVGTSPLTAEPMTPMRGNFRPEDGEKARPEKSTAAAARMIAAGLGVRPPKKTEEMKRYERAIREKEGKRQDQAKEEKKEAEEAKRAIWED
jgi:hypothetical protein